MHRDFSNHTGNAQIQECQRPSMCINCGATHIWWLGYHSRSASYLDGDRVVYCAVIVARRVRCATCRASWILRALSLFPWRHFQLDVVAGSLSKYLFDAKAGRDGKETQRSVAAWAKCAERTLRRWIQWVGEVSSPRELAARLTEITEQPIRLKLKSVFVQDETQKGRTESRRKLLRTTAWVLTLLEGIGQALSLEPPGLESVLLRVVGDQAGLTTYQSPRLPHFARILTGSGFAMMYA